MSLETVFFWMMVEPAATTLLGFCTAGAHNTSTCLELLKGRVKKMRLERI